MVSKCPRPSLGLRVHLSELGISEPPGRWSGPVWGGCASPRSRWNLQVGSQSTFSNKVLLPNINS